MKKILVFLRRFFSPLKPVYTFGYINDNFLNDTFTIKVRYEQNKKK
jgi:hypothetical protein